MTHADDEGTIYEYPKGSGIWWAQLPADEQGKRPKRRVAMPIPISPQLCTATGCGCCGRPGRHR